MGIIARLLNHTSSSSKVYGNWFSMKTNERNVREFVTFVTRRWSKCARINFSKWPCFDLVAWTSSSKARLNTTVWYLTLRLLYRVSIGRRKWYNFLRETHSVQKLHWFHTLPACADDHDRSKYQLNSLCTHWQYTTVCHANQIGNFDCLSWAASVCKQRSELASSALLKNYVVYQFVARNDKHVQDLLLIIAPWMRC